MLLIYEWIVGLGGVGSLSRDHAITLRFIASHMPLAFRRPFRPTIGELILFRERSTRVCVFRAANGVILSFI